MNRAVPQSDSLQVAAPVPAAPAASENLPFPCDVEVWICLDFEWTCDDGEVRKVRGDNVEIIEFAYTVYDAKFGILACEGQYYCKNETTPITEFCTDLTGISDETLADAGSLADALEAFKENLRAHGLEGRPCCAVTHGSADLELILPQHCGRLELEVPSVLQRYVDLRLAAQSYVAAAGNTGSRVSTLKQICEALGVEMIGAEHCGLDDSYMVLLALQQLLKVGADLNIVDLNAERRLFVGNESFEQEICLDGLPFFVLPSEMRLWLEENIGTDLPDIALSIVLGMDSRPSGRLVVDCGNAETAKRALNALSGGKLIVSGTAPSTRSERLVLARPLRREEQELKLLGLQVVGPCLARFQMDDEAQSYITRHVGVCFDFQRGCCTRGDACRYLHRNGASTRTLGALAKQGACMRGGASKFAHEPATPGPSTCDEVTSDADKHSATLETGLLPSPTDAREQDARCPDADARCPDVGMFDFDELEIQFEKRELEELRSKESRDITAPTQDEAAQALDANRGLDESSAPGSEPKDIPDDVADQEAQPDIAAPAVSLTGKTPAVSLAGKALYDFDGGAHGPAYLTLLEGMGLINLPHPQTNCDWIFGAIAVGRPGWFPAALFSSDGGQHVEQSCEKDSAAYGTALADFDGDAFGEEFLTLVKSAVLANLQKSGDGWMLGVLLQPPLGWFPAGIIDARSQA